MNVWRNKFRCAILPTPCKSIQGSLYVNDFNLFGRTWQVIVQAEPQFRDQIEDIPRLRACAAPTDRWFRSDRWRAFAK